MVRWIVLLASCALASMGCRKRCEPGFLSQGGSCVAFNIDGGVDGNVPRPRPDAGDGGVVGPQPDAGFRPTRDGGGGIVDGGPATFGRILLRGQAVLPMTSDAIIAPGEVLVVDDRIECVGGVGVCDAVNATIVDTNGVILPGLVDAHNHVAYNWLPEWSPGRLFSDHDQWQAASDYRAYVEPYSDNSTGAGLCAMVQWGEIRALVNGVTTIFGTPRPRVCYRWLVRNAELSPGYSGWDRDRMRSNTLGIDTVDPMEAMNLAALMDMGEVTAYMIHLAEGISTRAHDEYVDLVGLGLLRPETVIIHGTALTPQDFMAVANAGSKVVWSPSSNMALYGDTTNIQAAINAGVSVSISPDWTPSGKDDTLPELRFARDLVEQRWPGLFTDADYLAMATIIPAAQMAVDRDVGTLEPDRYADILVLNVDATTPYDAVLQARPQDIQLVLIGGVPSYGDPSLLDGLIETPGDCFDLSACGTTRRACWAMPPDNSRVTPEGVANTIQGFYDPGPHDLFDCN